LTEKIHLLTEDDSHPTEELKPVRQGFSNMKITTLTGFYANTTFSPSHPVADEVWDDTNRFYLDLLNEAYRDVKFYYNQSKKGSARAGERVTRTLNGLARTIRRSVPQTVDRFFYSIEGDWEWYWFIISTFTDYKGIDPVFYIEKLSSHLLRSNLLAESCKTALQRSQAATLAPLIEKAFPQATLAVQLDLLEILHQRGEWNETWLNRLRTESDPIITNKLKSLQCLAGSKNSGN
jgi:hypothetical protein